jgi:hypothetical protein
MLNPSIGVTFTEVPIWQMLRLRNSATTTPARYESWYTNLMDMNHNEFEEKFKEMINNEEFEPPLVRVALDEIADTLASLTLASAEIAALLCNVMGSPELEVEESIYQLLINLRDSSDIFFQDFEIEIEKEDDDELED